jgi:hypothetical protein
MFAIRLRFVGDDSACRLGWLRRAVHDDDSERPFRIPNIAHEPYVDVVPMPQSAGSVVGQSSHAGCPCCLTLFPRAVAVAGAPVRPCARGTRAIHGAADGSRRRRAEILIGEPGDPL